MLVEDPVDTIKTMCQFRETTVDLRLFKAAYEKMKRRTTPIHEKHAHTHFYSLSVYGLIVPVKTGPRGAYEVSKIGRELCECLDKRDNSRFKQILSTILLNDPSKGMLYREFLSFIGEKRKRSRAALYERFKPIPARTLIEWCKTAGLVEANHDFVWSLPQGEKVVLTLEQFREELVEAYKRLSKPEMLGLEKIFVEIKDLRQTICIDHGWRVEEFDESLRRLLNSPFGQEIRLYGAPSSLFDERESFLYNEKLYIYIRIKV